MSTRSLPSTIRVWLARPLSVVLKCPIGRIDLFRGVSDHGAAKTMSGSREQGTVSHGLHSRVTVCSFVPSFRKMCPNKTDQLSEQITDHLYYPQKSLKATVCGLLAPWKRTKSFLHPLRSRKKPYVIQNFSVEYIRLQSISVGISSQFVINFWVQTKKACNNPKIIAPSWNVNKRASYACTAFFLVVLQSRFPRTQARPLISSLVLSLYRER